MSFSGYNSDHRNDEMDIIREEYQYRNFEVFLSFRGQDTRASFISHLYTALWNAGFYVFKDDKSLPRGNQIAPSLRLAIEKSRISVVLFSRNYAESRWCLIELEKIMECHRTIGHVVLPVFYDVDPSEVRHQTGHFGKAFQNLSNKILEEKVLDWMQRWRKTLCEAGGISGLIVLNSGGKMKIAANEIDVRVESWREALYEAAGILGGAVLNSSGQMEIANKIDLFVDCWKNGLCLAARISRYSVFLFGYMNTAMKIDLLVKHWREAICEVAGISEGAVLNSWEEMDITNKIDLLVKNWREAFCEAATSSGVAGLNYSEKEMARDFESLVIHWRVALHEAASISRFVGLNSRPKMDETNLVLKRWTEALRRLLVSQGL